MNYADALMIAEGIRLKIEPVCFRHMIGGGLRRHKRDVHDIEMLCVPYATSPVPKFGDRVIHKTHLDKVLYELEGEGLLMRVKGKDRMKQYVINTEHWGIKCLNEFKIEFYICLPPAQFGIQAVIRTGPGSEEDNFSRQCVTPRADGGYLPDGYRVKHLAVWNANDLDAKGEPLPHKTPWPMPEEEDFLRFLGLGWIEPSARHAHWVRNGRP